MGTLYLNNKVIFSKNKRQFHTFKVKRYFVTAQYLHILTGAESRHVLPFPSKMTDQPNYWRLYLTMYQR